MDQQQVLDFLQAMGVQISQRTLQRYATQGLIEFPEVRSLGYGQGRESRYTANAVLEAYTAAKMLGKTAASFGVHNGDARLPGGHILRIPRRRITVADVRAAREWANSLAPDRRERAERGDETVSVRMTEASTDEDLFALLLVNVWLRTYGDAAVAFDDELERRVREQKAKIEADRKRTRQDLERMIDKS